MANCATSVVVPLSSQILEVLRDQRMTFTQLSTYYSIKYRASLNERLKGAKAANVKEYLEGLDSLFEVQGDSVKARPKNTSQNGNSEKPAIATIRYAHISKALQSIINETQSNCLDIGDLETVFQSKFSASLVSLIGMPTVEYLQRKANVFEIDGNVVRLHSAFQKEKEVMSEEKQMKDVKSEDVEGTERASKGRQAWADLPVFSEPDLCTKPKASKVQANQQVQKPSNAKESVGVDGLLNSLQSLQSEAPLKATSKPIKTNAAGDCKKEETKEKKSENLPFFAVDELVRIFEENTEGPIMHSSVLCSLFMQQLGASVTEISGKKPMELFRQHPETFIWLSSGNVALAKYRQDKAIQHELRLLEEQPKSVRVKAAAAEAALPVPDHVTEEDVIKYMVGLLQENAERDSIYISGLCGRFMQRFRKPVTEIVGCKPTDFMKKHKDIFYLEKGGHVKLVKDGELASASSTVAEVNTSIQAAQSPPKASPCKNADAKLNEEVQEKIESFCTRLRKQVFFRVTEVTSEALTQAPQSIQGRPPVIPVTVKVANLPKEMEAQWLPKLLQGLQQVLELKFVEEVDGVALEGEGVHCRLRNFSVGLFVRLVVA